MLDRMLRAILVFSLYLSFIAAISRNGIQGPMIFRIVWFYISVQSARSRLHMCWWDQTQVSYALFSTRMSTHTSARVRVLVRTRWQSSYCPRTRGASCIGGARAMEGNGTEKGSAVETREIVPLSHSFSPSSPLAPAALVHFLLSKIMTMLIFLTREEFFKLTCNQT